MHLDIIQSYLELILAIAGIAALFFNIVKWLAKPKQLKKYPGQSFFIQPEYFTDLKDNTRHNLFKEIKNVLQGKNPKKYFFILGDFGTGKTFFIRYLDYWLQKKQWHSAFKVKRVNLSYLNFDVEVKNICEEDQKKYILLLDGFDEDRLARADIQKRFHDILVATQGYSKVVLTSRLNFWLNLDLEGVAPFIENYLNIREFYYLAPFSEEQVKSYFRKKFWFLNTKLLYEGIKNNDLLNKILTRPLLLSYLDKELLKRIGNSVTLQKESRADRDFLNYGPKYYIRKIYEILIRNNFKLKDGAFFNNNQDAFDKLMAVIAYDLLVNHRTITVEGFEDYYREIKEQYKLNITFNHDYIKTISEEAAAVEDRTLLVKTENKIEFCHESFAEYYTALCIEQFYMGFGRMDFKIPTLEVGNFISDKLRFIPGGEFLTDPEDNRWKIKIGPLFMGICPVTNLEYEQFDPTHKNMRDKYSSADDEPVIHVSWEEANHYCGWLSKETAHQYRLPNEVEWEYACRAGSTGAYSLDVDGIEVNKRNLKDYAVYDTNKTMPVKRCKPNFYGLYDMHGNVWEWCWDNTKISGVLRGGSWYDDQPEHLCASRRLSNNSLNGSDAIGFRVVVCVERTP